MENYSTDSRTQWLILQAARAEFIAYGFRDSSLRRIAREVEITVSNIYNHFDNKDTLFRAVLAPLIEAIETVINEHNTETNMEIYVHTPDRYRDATVGEFIKLARGYRTDLKLLLLHSGGSSLEHYKEEIVERHVKSGARYLEAFKEKYPSTNTDVSPFFLRVSSMWWWIILSEIVSDDSLSEQEVEQGIREYITFGTAGWKALIQL
ncbi:TetR/AcrR family transcriptional regulator [Porphyromonas sp.]|uniref:TetR/AcrR family transcriptional regulator n=1 Tax=Porphyromonas sp. TaxID=1924944 RepID=UPI0026DB613F|nr:TetR/AcrR family transcriptional regulator [Porphyromonas sp.]MDO4695438.1 TetR/AcrR family transcriptional regulator [Porphyromonas sp.]MDO4771247.1 TetR/AcrR family transcriptional regulator [Porphyromonas sp.]